jgi:antitoxin component YwqK of YwqJK toxin-antitoxin module
MGVHLSAITEHKEYYKNGQIRSHEFRRDGISEGEFKSWYETGQLYGREFYRNGRLNGPSEWWHRNGHLWKQEFHRDGILDGECKEWYDDGVLKRQCFAQNGKLEGEYKYWFHGGVLSELQLWKNGIIQNRKLWDVEGNLWKHDIHQDNSLETKEWGFNGQLRRRVFYKNDKREGKWTNWYENGNPENREFYMDGEPEGESISWDENGTIYSRELWRNMYDYHNQVYGEAVDRNFTVSKRDHLLRFKTEIAALAGNLSYNSLSQFLIGDLINTFCKHTHITFENDAIQTWKLYRRFTDRS